MRKHCGSTDFGLQGAAKPRALPALRITRALFFAALLPFSVTALAQTPADRDLLRDRQQKLLEDQRQKLEQLKQLPGERAPERPVEAPAEAGRCIDIAHISIEGAHLMTEARQRALVAPFEGRCLETAQFNELLKAFTQYYLDRGYITTRAYLPEQDLSSGELKILIIEGQLQKIERGENAPSTREIYMSLPGGEGDLLNLRPLEQMLDQLGRLPSRQAKIDIVPGTETGQSNIKLEGEAQKSWRVSLARDNSGQKSTGRQQWRTSIYWDSPLGLADQLILIGGRDADTQKWRRSNNQSIHYGVPYGWWTFSYAYSRNYYQAENEAPGLGFSFKTDGTSNTHQLRAERILHRDATSKTGASAGLSHMRSRNYFEGELLEVSSQHLSELQIGVNHGRRIGGAFVNLDLGWQRGVGMLDAQGRGHPHGSEPDAHYNKYTLAISYLHPFTLKEQPFSFESLAYGQHTRDALFSLQRFGLGGLSSVRGFDEQLITGNSGGYWRNQLRWRHNPGWETLRRYVETFSVALGYDTGAIARNKRTGDGFESLSGAALELTAQGKNLVASLTLARALDKPRAIHGGEMPVYFSVGLTY
ncbi:MAG: ShlB/FhaC/HecB family hemolysin secretion/activation protein [Azoarcus sp.]|nr:ShlB/FhaC/HecB family hemolysin secretion/activation protein [Azoarcus sp.]